MKIQDLPETIDLGDGRWLEFFTGDTDDAIVFTEHHLTPGGKECTGGGYFDVPECPPTIQDSQKWTVESWDPLTLSPSILCRRCGNHGFIRNGKWESC